MPSSPRTLLLFNYDWDAVGHRRAGAAQGMAFDEAGFDLFSFPSNARLAWFDMERFVQRLARQAPARGWTAVTSNHEQFGALAAALLAERMGWRGTPVAAILACQHKLHARQVLQRVAPEANLDFALLDAEYGAPIPSGIAYPRFVKPVKAAFSVLARTVDSHAELHRHTRFGAWELWVIRRLVEPFERMAQQRLGPGLPSAHRMLLEAPVQADQFNLDGYAFGGDVHAIGVVDAVMYPGTQAFMRFELPSKLPPNVQARALDVARRFLQAVGFTHGLFNMEFFYDAATDRLTVIEFNPRMAAQFSDLYLRVQGLDLHAVSLALAHGHNPASVARTAPTAGAAASFVYRVFDAQQPVTMPDTARQQALAQAFPDALLFAYPKPRGSMARDFKWLGSYRYGILHLGGRDTADLRQRCAAASALLGWPAPCPEPATPRLALTAVPAPQQPPQHQPLPAMPTTETST
ncbi:MAG: ATP-grasp domain-containing protein [Hydrogenophaga sp.]|uniref:ATP-grasp domain-containing protein n=1 Tax=Hydrogenophaga sp. TaxID=1904254 RepID=UPI0027227CF0|nr:ATP-grasp domain-containing protein [Hydrogenophaga sp.]MDO9479965.1 ATP-grasp domain-containing protein [Hydrogenophaga sp.]MDP3346142.1 ATP-grasp domain-containing protein [Hydrogenophaga sp.]MDP3808940.1 ATP-grasp domain-containing protein [Hydrogenophaga sp.]